MEGESGVSLIASSPAALSPRSRRSLFQGGLPRSGPGDYNNSIVSLNHRRVSPRDNAPNRTALPDYLLWSGLIVGQRDFAQRPKGHYTIPTLRPLNPTLFEPYTLLRAAEFGQTVLQDVFLFH